MERKDREGTNRTEALLQAFRQRMGDGYQIEPSEGDRKDVILKSSKTESRRESSCTQTPKRFSSICFAGEQRKPQQSWSRIIRKSGSNWVQHS